MSVDSYTYTTTPNSQTRMDIVIVFTDHTGGTTTIEKLVANDFDIVAFAEEQILVIEKQLAETEIVEALNVAETEISPEKVAVHQTQADFDRRLLGRLMMVQNVHTFYAGYDFFQAVEGRGGANKVSRAAYLGVSLSDYDLVDKRFGDIKGIEFFINDEKGRVWEEPLDGWE